MEDEEKFYKDSKFKQFNSAVEKALKSFEYSSEWADLISCLGKLNKVILTYSKFPVIPKKLLVGKRLAQCLHPALPSGVHLKALDTYRLIFNQIGSTRLTQDIFIYSSGLFPLLGQAAISVKPILLDIYDEHYVPLGKNLIPGLPGFIMALLPGIEEASEHTERTMEILEKVCKNTNKSSFFSALWGCSLHSSPVRLSAIMFVLQHLSKQSPQTNKLYVIGNNKHLMVNALCTSLEDTNVLVQRITLDFLLCFIPLQSEVVTQSQLVSLVMYSLTVVLRRDMSLNRRLYQWILNVNSEGLPAESSRKSSVASNPSVLDDESPTSLNYFENYSKKYVVAAVINLFYTVEPEHKYTAAENELFPRRSRKYDKLKPFRILISLLDKPEIGSSVLEHVLVEVFRVLRRECEADAGQDSLDSKDKKQRKGLREELIKTANLLFNAFEPYFIWDYLEKLILNCFADSDEKSDDGEDVLDGQRERSYVREENTLVTPKAPGCLEILQIIEFLLDIVVLEAVSETQTEHWPSLLNCIIAEMTQHIHHMTLKEINHGILLALKLLSKVSPSITSPKLPRLDPASYLGHISRQKTGSSASRENTELESEANTPCNELAMSESEDSSFDPARGRKAKRLCDMESCIENSKTFFTKYVSHCVSSWMSKNGLNSIEKERASEGYCDLEDKSKSEDDVMESESLLLVMSFTSFCRYLVELSCFPSWKPTVPSSTMSDAGDGLRSWVEALVCCAKQVKNFSVQSAAIGTLLDLINVSLCVFPSSSRDITSSGSANVVPLISKEDFDILEKSTIYKDFAYSLWDRIRHNNSQLHYTCTELFLRLHNIAPFALVCEDVVSNSMVNHYLHVRQRAHWKFSVLWHLSREFYKNESSKSSRGGSRTLDRCMLLMLDSVNNEDPNIRKCVQEWLKHAIHYGDIGRLLEPLLLIMLNPTSRRISVHYASLWVSENQNAAPGRGREHKVSTNENSDGRNDASSDSDREDDLNNASDSIRQQRSESITSRSHSDREAESFHETEVFKVDSTAENEFADDEDEDPKEPGKETHNSAGQKVKKTPKTDQQKKRNNNPLLKTSLSIDDLNSPSSKLPTEKNSRPVHPLHVHRLFYTHPYDTTQTMYALKAIMSIVEADGRAFVCAAATTSMNMCNTGHQSGLRELLIRHRRALTGKDFYGSLADSQQLLIKASTAKYMEILLSICLYFVRSDYHSSIPASESDIQGNFCVKIASIQLLTRIIHVLLEVVIDSGAGFSSFTLDLFSRCKVQRIALHCLLSHVYQLSNEQQEQFQAGQRSKDVYSSVLNSGIDGKKAFDIQKNLLQLIKYLVFLEDRIGVEQSDQNSDKSKSKSGKDRKSRGHQRSVLRPFEFSVGKPIASQAMFLSVILSAIKEEKWYSIHHEWNSLVIATLPKLGPSLPRVAVPVVDQISLNLKNITKMFVQSASGKLENGASDIPVDYMLTLLEDLTSICHYCLIENEVVASGVSMAPRQLTTSSKSSRHNDSEDATTSIFSNLVHVFSSQGTSNKTTVTEEVDKPMVEAREGLLSILPTMMSSLVTVWQAWSSTDAQKSRWKIATEVPLPIGNNKNVRQSILQLLTPIAMQHTIVFLAAVADVWNLTKNKDGARGNQTQNEKDKDWLTSMNQKILPITSKDQLALLEIIMAIKVLSLEKIIETSKQILRQTVMNKDKPTNPGLSLEVNVMQFLHGLLLKTSHEQLKQVKTPLLALLKDSLQLGTTPPALFVLLNVFYVFVVRVPIAEERRCRRELQDLAMKFVEACNTIASASLDSSTWFRRTVAVVQQSDQSTDMDESSLSDKVPPAAEAVHNLPASIQTRNAQYSAQSLCVMAELLSSMLDLLYISEEKDKIASGLFYVMYNITPYLKNHSAQNVTSFRACSALLSAITDYQYTLRAWKKDVYELFLENDFFKLDLLSLHYWRSIIDRLMTYDSATFKDLMSRINLSQSGAINIFANREQEMEQRAQLLKRLTFTIFCGEVDQYHNYVPDIQERLVESLRQMQAPVLHEQVFFCFRVLILRMSPHHLTSLWPSIITELILVFLQMERDLATGDNQRTKTGILGTLESFFGLNGLHQNRQKWHGLYLEACKLLDLSVALHNDAVPHFQLYRWAFIDTPGVEVDEVLDAPLTSEQGQAEAAQSGAEGKQNTKERKSSAEKCQPSKAEKVTENVSKLSVMNAPLTSKLRKQDKKTTKSKSTKEMNNKNNILSKFTPYISKISKILAENSTVTQSKSIDGRLFLDARKINSLEDLLPFFLALSSADVSGSFSNKKVFDLDYAEVLIEKDFQEIPHKQQGVSN